ncbi:uncharacterized protein LOC117324153 isoform X2 [Pecten maximus]|uniref:uncharacterized protein LOC117324153 isoform X2 n=1 Tax=Pecten maximus TaxID=6579 RepID=UPI0014588A85|nr:uncharacterized protein LOC117324153 isoform X2 [Pecten maximus]
MAEDTAIEKHIKTFVSNKIGESVYLDLSKSKFVIIKHKVKRGSISLASLWIRVLQHHNNYPVQHYPYRTLYEANGNRKIKLKIDDVTMTVFLTTGTLTIQGNFVLEWFTQRFEDILRNYDAPDGPSQPVLAMFTQYENQWGSILEKEKETADALLRKEWEKEEEALRKADDLPTSLKYTLKEPEGSLQKVDGDVNRTLQQLASVRLDNYDDQWESILEKEKETADEVLRKEWGKEEEALCKADELLVSVKESLKPEGSSQNLDSDVNRTLQQLAFVRLDNLEEEGLSSQLEKLKQGCVLDGPTVIYPLWKDLLNHWFSNQANKVYIATPFIDTARLLDICQLVLKHKLTANLEAFYVRLNCDHKLQISDIRRNAQNQLEPKDQVFIEYKVYNRFVYPLKRFHAKFLACVNNGQAQVMVTSASFHADHFHSPNLESVLFLTMSEAEFTHRYLRTMQASQLEVTIKT